MLRMRVLFHDGIQHPKAIRITDKLSVLYRPVVDQSCKLSDGDAYTDQEELNNGPMANRHLGKLGIDYVRGHWWGEYV